MNISATVQSAIGKSVPYNASPAGQQPMLLRQYLFKCYRRHSAAVFLASCLLAVMKPAHAEYYIDHGKLDTNWNCWQIDAAIDPAGVIHMICEQYYQFDLSGQLLSAESEAQDRLQGSLTYPPALSLDPVGNVHVLLREPAGDHIFDDGQWITYRVRDSDGNWLEDSRNYLLGDPVGRNNLLGLVAVSEDEVYAHHGVVNDTSNVWGNVRFLKLGDRAADSLGEWSGIWRADLGTRMLKHENRVHFASANAFLRKQVFFSRADASDELLTDLKRNAQAHESGENDKRGSPDIAVDQSGAAHIIYGAREEVYYNRYTANGGKVFLEDQAILGDLGTWHLSFGMASIAVSDDGEKILVLGLKTNGHKEANDSKIVLTYSLDGGETWSEQIETGQITHGGEGRMRPRLLTYQDKFIVLYYDSKENWMSMVTVNMQGLPSLAADIIPSLDAVRTLLLDR